MIRKSYHILTRLRFEVIGPPTYVCCIPEGNAILWPQQEHIMKTWTKPAVREQEVGLEVTSYLPAEIDII